MDEQKTMTVSAGVMLALAASYIDSEFGGASHMAEDMRLMSLALLTDNFELTEQISADAKKAIEQFVEQLTDV